MLANDIDTTFRPRRFVGDDEGWRDVDDSPIGQIFLRARRGAVQSALAYAGAVSPSEAWTLASAQAAVIVDVRTAEERHFVGHVPDSLHVPWATGLAMTANPDFLRELNSKVSEDTPILFLCRSAKRSHAAAEAAARAGYLFAFNILEGFEGDRDEQQHRGKTGGWRFHGLPWSQD
jgi:rhodanese-related sulfurtransferase